MKQIMLLKKFPWYALLIAIYSPLTLLAENAGEVGPFAANRTMGVVLLGEFLLMVTLFRVYRDWQKTGLVAALLTVLILSYGHVYNLLENVEITGLTIGRHRYLLTVWMGMVLLIFYLAGKIKRLSIIEDAVKSISLVLFVLVVIRLAAFYFAEWRAFKGQTPVGTARHVLQAEAAGGVYPDVYYIILDGYGRSDVLANSFDVDNTDFLNSLRSMGFYVAGCSQSNYAHTQLSLASSLNYNYLDDLGSDFVPGGDGWSDLTALIRSGAVRSFFEGENYRIVAFETGYAWTEWRDADLFVAGGESVLSKNLTSFEALFLHTTLGAVAFDFGWIPESQQNVRHYELILSNLDALANLAGEDGPKFVFAHLVIPHSPFVFDANGGYRRDPSLSPAFDNYTDEENYNGYRQQVMFINTRILEVVESILSKSERKTLIILQGDHGPSHTGEEARMSILNAYYLPDGSAGQLYASISPVNTFRFILNSYFGQNLSLLPDISYFSKNADPFSYKEIPNKCKP